MSQDVPLGREKQEKYPDRLGLVGYQTGLWLPDQRGGRGTFPASSRPKGTSCDIVAALLLYVGAGLADCVDAGVVLAWMDRFQKLVHGLGFSQARTQGFRRGVPNGPDGRRTFSVLPCRTGSFGEYRLPHLLPGSGVGPRGFLDDRVVSFHASLLGGLAKQVPGVVSVGVLSLSRSLILAICSCLRTFAKWRQFHVKR